MTVQTGQKAKTCATFEIALVSPLEWSLVVAYFRQRVITGVEHIDHECFQRSFALNGSTGLLELRPTASRRVLTGTVYGDNPPLAEVKRRLCRQFDADADPAQIRAHLGTDPHLASKLSGREAMRLFGAFDAFELGVRAILGQQISVTAASRLTARLVERWGRPIPAPGAGLAGAPVTFYFPEAIDLSQADVTSLGMPAARGRAIAAFASALVQDPNLLEPTASLSADLARLCNLPGIGPWTANYIAIRAMHHQDAFPAADIGLLRAMANGSVRPSPIELEAMAELWRPYRAYAAMMLWSGGTGG